MVSVRLKYVVEDEDRHGNVRVYFRRNGRKVRLRNPVGSPEFLAEYEAAAKDVVRDQTRPGAQDPAESFRWLCSRYFSSTMWTELDPKTKATRRGILERFAQHKGNGNHPFKLLQARHVRARRDEMANTPEAANSMIKALRQLFRFAMRYELHDRNPADDVELLKSNGEGYHSWTIEEIEQFEAAHPIGTTPRLAFALALYTAQRRSDIVRLGRQHLKNGRLKFTQQKGRHRNPVHLEIPVLPELARIIDAGPTGDLTFLVTAYGRPFSEAGFGIRFREWCNAAGLPHCSVHGLRKAAAARLAEHGCSEFEIMAITGHQTSKEVTRYTKAASQRARAEAAFSKLQGRS